MVATTELTAVVVVVVAELTTVMVEAT
jgi:hypothetical protein